MKSFILLFAILLSLNSLSLATYYNTGWKTFEQPDGTRFVGKIEGDEYYFKHTTKEGYAFYRSSNDKYYYYATGINSKKYSLSDQKVGIHAPGNLPKNLVVHIADRPDAPFEPRHTRDELKKTSVTTYTLKVVLVEFDDVSGDSDYETSDFEDMLDGSSYTGTSPDGENVYGSMDYYYNRMSGGDCRINATVLNSTDANGKPVWLTLPDDKEDYNDGTSNFWSDAASAATSAGFNITTGSTTKLVYIYAGNFYTDNLVPAAQPSSNRYRMCEKWGGRGYYNDETTGTITFSHIGIHCHEFGHLLGFYDQYIPPNDIVDWCLMGDACDLGKGARPGPICPHYRYWKGWISTTTPTQNTGVNLTYSETSPVIYRIVSGSDVFYFENREYSDFSSLLPGNSSGTRGILVWKTNGSHTIDLIAADGSGGNGNENYGDMFPGSSSNENLDDFTSPNCNRLNGTNSQIIMHDVSSPTSATMTAVLGEGWFYELPQNVTWSGDVLISGDLEVPSGKTLTISSGSTISVSDSDGLSSGSNSSKCELIVEGTLDAEGTTFTADAARDWYGIKFTSTATNCQLDGCTIENADYNVRIEGSSPTVEDCTLDGGLYGVYVKNSTADPDVSECDIKNVTYGIGNFVSSTGDYYNNKIQTSSSASYARCIWISSGDGNFYSNSLNYSHDWGVYIFGSTSNPDLTGDYTGTERGNYFDSNMGDDVISISSGSPVLGYGFPSGACGYNVFEGVPSGYYYIDNNTGSSLQAEYNYWDDGTEPSTSDFDGTIDYTPWRTTLPNAGTTWKANVATTLYVEVLQAFRNRDYEKVIESAPAAFAIDAKHALAHPAVNRYFSSLDRLGKLTINEINSKLESEFFEDVQQVARGWKIRYHAHNNNMAEAEKTAFSVTSGSVFERALLLDLVYFYAALEDEESIARIKKALTDNHKDNDISTDIQIAIDSGRESVELDVAPLPKENDPLEIMPNTFAVRNYPNPCNPATFIRFSLPDAGHVTVNIFNVRGQKVCDVVDENYSAGHHVVRWDGRDDFDQMVATGIYFYNIQFEGQAKTNKILMLR